MKSQLKAEVMTELAELLGMGETTLALQIFHITESLNNTLLPSDILGEFEAAKIAQQPLSTDLNWYVSKARERKESLVSGKTNKPQTYDEAMVIHIYGDEDVIVLYHKEAEEYFLELPTKFFPQRSMRISANHTKEEIISLLMREIEKQQTSVLSKLAALKIRKIEIETALFNLA